MFVMMVEWRSVAVGMVMRAKVAVMLNIKEVTLEVSNIFPLLNSVPV